MMDVPLIVTVECRAIAYLTPTRDRISPIRTGRRATTLVPRRLPSAVVAHNPQEALRSWVGEALIDPFPPPNGIGTITPLGSFSGMLPRKADRQAGGR